MVNYDTPRQYLNLTGQIFDIYHHSVSCDFLTYGGLPLILSVVVWLWINARDHKFMPGLYASTSSLIFRPVNFWL